MNLQHGQNELPAKPLEILRAIAAAGLGDRTPSIDVMAARPWLTEQTGFSDGEVKAALKLLVGRGYIQPIEPEQIALTFKRNYAVRGRKNGRPAQWYRLLPPPVQLEALTPDYGALDAVLAELSA